MTRPKEAAAKLTSRERMLRALNRQQADHTPCCFMNFRALRERHNNDFYELVKAERAMGLDSELIFPTFAGTRPPEHPVLRGLPIRLHPDVKIREWYEDDPDGWRILHKEYTTPAGPLTTSMRQSDDWPFGDHIPFADDHMVPRAVKPLITEPEDLEAFQYLLIPPAEQDVAKFREEVGQGRAFADEHGVLLTGMMGVGPDMATWLCGMQDLMMLTMEQPGFITDLLEMIHGWNMQRMELVLSAPVDLYIRRAWYEGCDVFTETFFRESILPHLKMETALAHERGAKFGYTCTSGTVPMLDAYLEADLDVLIGIDPLQDRIMDMPRVREKLGGRICLWGGVSTMTVEEETDEQRIRLAVTEAIETLGPDGLILSPMDICIDSPRTWHNVDILIDEWRRHC